MAILGWISRDVVLWLAPILALIFVIVRRWISSSRSSFKKGSKQFYNWCGNISIRPKYFHMPETQDEIIAIIQHANRAGERVKVAGALHSWSGIACTSGHLINLDRYNKVLHVDRDKMTVKVQAGIRLKHLIQYLFEREGLALSNLGSVSEQSIAGILSTATHGSGLRFGVLASCVIELELILSSGEVKTLSCSSSSSSSSSSAVPEDDKQEAVEDLFHAAVVSIGSLGVISTVTIQCEPAFRLHLQEGPMHVDKMLSEEGDALLQHNEHVKFWWFPHTDYVQVYKSNRTNKPINARSRLREWIEDVLLQTYILELIIWSISHVPRLIPTVVRIVQKIGFKSRDMVNRGDKILLIPMPPKHLELEYSVPITHWKECFRRLKRLLDDDDDDNNNNNSSSSSSSRVRVNFIVEIRFVKADQIWLSPAYGRDSCFFTLCLYNLDCYEYFRLFEDEVLCGIPDARPHWGKLHSMTSEQLRGLYPRWADFCALRRRLDPHKMFWNDYLDRVLGDDDPDDGGNNAGGSDSNKSPPATATKTHKKPLYNRRKLLTVM